MDRYHLKAVRAWTGNSLHLILTPGISAKSMFYYVQEIGHFHTLPRYSTEREHLSSFLALYTASGSGYLKYEGKTYKLGKGQLFFIDCEKHQYYETDKTDLWEIVWVHFNGVNSRSYYELFRKYSEPVIQLPADSPIPDGLQKLLQVCSKKDAVTELVCSRLIMELLTEILLNVMRRDRKLQPEVVPPYVSQMLDFLDKHYQDKITLSQLALNFNVSKFHLQREFKRHIGLTPNEYLINTRITAAKDMLKYSTMSVNDIAAHTGFDNVSHFINTFKGFEQTTPLNFRKNWKESH